MNNVCLIGRLTSAPELNQTNTGHSVCRFSIAVDRKFKSEGQPTADFINVVAWRQTADFVAKYFGKGNRIALTGSIQTRNWEDNEGKKHYATEVVADNVEFCESKKESSEAAKESNLNLDGYVPLPEDDDCLF